MTLHETRRQQTATRPGVTNRGLWWARHLRLRTRQLACEPGCPVCDEVDGYHPDYSTPPPSTLARDLT